jgi:hypothetical protein
MSAKNCIILQSCKTNNYVFTRSVDSQPANEPFWTGLLNTVVQITDPANFPDIYYFVIEICSSNSVDPASECLACFNNTPYADGVALEYVIPTGLTECPNVDAYVLLNCKAGPNVFTLAMTPEEIAQSPETALVTSSDLSLYVGSVVNIEEYPGNCYQVLGPYGTQTGCPCPYYTITNAFKDCECCLPPVPEVFVRTTQKPFKNFTRITETECEIRTIEKFAVNYYNYFRQLKYGLQNCCGDHDLDKLWMDMQMVTFNRMQNGTCTVPTEEVVVSCPISPLA